MRIVALILFCFPAGDCRLWTSSHQGGRVDVRPSGTHFFPQEIAGYGPLQSSHQGDHKEIAGYGACLGPLQSSHQVGLKSIYL